MPNAAVVNALTLDVERQGDRAVVHCHGKLAAGVGQLLYTRVHELINLGKQIRELLGITNLLSVFAGICEQGVTMKF